MFKSSVLMIMEINGLESCLESLLKVLEDQELLEDVK